MKRDTLYGQCERNITGNVNIRGRGWTVGRGAVRRERARLFSLPERFNQVHIGAADQKDPPLVCGSRSRVFTLLRLLPSQEKKN